MAHAALSRKTLTSSGVTESAILISAVHNICPMTWWARSNIAFACGFLIVVGLRLISYESHSIQNSIWIHYHCCILSANIVGIYSNRIYWLVAQCDLSFWSKIFLDASDSLPSTVIVLSHRTRGNSTILNQLDAGSIMVRAMKSMTEPSLPLRV